MKKTWIGICLLTLCMMSLTACTGTKTEHESIKADQTELQAEKQTENETENQTEEQAENQTENQNEEMSSDIYVDFVREYEDYNEYGTVIAREGMDVVWSYQTGYYPAAELDQVQMLPAPEGIVYVLESGTIIALDYFTGEELWRNEDFQGGGAEGIIDTDGTLYACGYYGPDLFIMDKNGKTIHRAETFSEDYWWPMQLELKDGKIRIYYLSNEQWLTVDLSDYSYVEE